MPEPTTEHRNSERVRQPISRQKDMELLELLLNKKAVLSQGNRAMPQ